MWINKYIAHTGHCSRREADKLVGEGRVIVNGDVAEKTQHVYESDIVKVDGKYLRPPSRYRIYIALNKPVGVVCTTETNIPNNIIDFVGHEQRIFPIGRMDRESQGLILLTNDGDIVNRFTEEHYGVEKEYTVRVNRKISWDFMNALQAGVELDGKLVRPVRFRKLGPNVFRIVVTQEMRRQIRRMCSKLGYKVLKLERIRVLHINVKDLPLGDWRYLSKIEVKRMFGAIRYHPAQKWNMPGQETTYHGPDNSRVTFESAQKKEILENPPAPIADNDDDLD